MHRHLDCVDCLGIPGDPVLVPFKFALVLGKIYLL